LLACSGDGTSGPDSGTSASLGPCAENTWGEITSPPDAIHVRADGSDDGDGSELAPFGTLEAALEATRAAGGGASIAVGPGTFDATLVLVDDSGDGTSDDGLSLEGCGTDETTLQGSSSASVIRASGIQDLRIAGLRIEGGRRSLLFQGGTEATLSAVEVQGGRRVGLVVAGSSTLVELDGVELRDTEPEVLTGGGSMGYGLSVDSGTVTMEGGGIWGSTGVGVLAVRAHVDLREVTIADTLPGADGLLGRGVQLQELAFGSLSGGTLSGNVDAGIFATQAIDLIVDGTLIEATAAGGLPNGEGTTGDGVVVTQGATRDYDPSEFTATLHGLTISGTDRAAVVLDGVTADLADHDHQDNGLVVAGSSTFTQGGAVITGNVADHTLEADTELALNHVAVTLDDLKE